MTDIAYQTTVARRRWQFSLRTLLLVVTLLSAIFAGAAWWVTLPLRTWRQFVGRVEAGDVEGANALCDSNMLRIVAVGQPKTATQADSRPQQTYERSEMLLIAGSLVPNSRSWYDLLAGRVFFESSFYGPLEVRRGRIASGLWPKLVY